MSIIRSFVSDSQYEWHRLSQIWGLCWQTQASSRHPGYSPDYCECVRACVKRCHYVCSVRDDVSAEGHGSPFGPREGNGAKQSELAGEAARPLGALLEALSSRGTVAVNSCYISPHTAWWSQQNQLDLVKSCTVFVSKILVSPQIHLIISVLSAVWVSAGMPSNTVLLSSKLI